MPCRFRICREPLQRRRVAVIIQQRVNARSVYAGFKMDVVSGADTRTPHKPDCLPLRDGITHADVHDAQMGIQGAVAHAVVDDTSWLPR